MEFSYKAFLSYSHAADRQLAATVQRAVQRLGKPVVCTPFGLLTQGT